MESTTLKALVMKRAWTIYKNCRKMFPTFKSALIQAWFVEKENIQFRKQQSEISEHDLRDKYRNHDFKLDNSERIFAYDKH